MRVLGCGYPKTGSTSLHDALDYLGYRVGAWNKTLAEEYMKGRRLRIWWNARRFNAYRDWPWIWMWRDFDRTRWAQRFVLTTRDPDTWFESLVRHTDRAIEKHGPEFPTRITRFIFEVNHPLDDKDACIESFLTHKSQVMEHFRGSDKLLVLNAEAGDGWEELCSFLKLRVPNLPYPHSFKHPG